jgi:hypothetical protein
MIIVGLGLPARVKKIGGRGAAVVRAKAIKTTPAVTARAAGKASTPSPVRRQSPARPRSTSRSSDFSHLGGPVSTGPVLTSGTTLSPEAILASQLSPEQMWNRVLAGQALRDSRVDLKAVAFWDRVLAKSRGQAATDPRADSESLALWKRVLAKSISTRGNR